MKTKKSGSKAKQGKLKKGGKGKTRKDAFISSRNKRDQAKRDERPVPSKEI